jgi:hypothetical protein
MPKPPLAVRDVLQYLLLEDAEDLVPASIKYIGSAQNGGVLTHYWSFPGHDQVQWACRVNDALSVAHEVPDTIRQLTVPFAEHVKRKPPPLPPNAWAGRNLPKGAKPLWVPSSQVRMVDASFVASFVDDFDRVAAAFGARPSVDKHGGGAGPCRYFVLELSGNRLAMLESCAACRDIHLSLPVHARSGVRYWEDYFAVFDPLGLPLEQVFRQGGIVWTHRHPSPEALARTANHQRNMWIPP